jgi:hypothetical protein
LLWNLFEVNLIVSKDRGWFTEAVVDLEAPEEVLVEAEEAESRQNSAKSSVSLTGT